MVVATHKPMLCAPASEQGTEILGIDQDSPLHSKGHHLLGCVGNVEVVLNLRVAVHLVAQVIKGIQEWLRIGFHAA